MTYAQFRDHVLQLINQYSSNSVVLDNLYNDQSDYVLRIPSLYNSAMMDITTYGKPIIDVIDVSDCIHECEHGHDHHHHHHHCHCGYVTIDLPKDFIKMRPVRMEQRGRVYRSSDYQVVGNELKIKVNLLRFGTLEYEREPRPLDITPGADIEGVRLDGDRQMQMAAALWVAARLVMQDDSFAYSSFMNEYDERREIMAKDMTAEVLHTPDVYGTEEIYWGCWGI